MSAHSGMMMDIAEIERAVEQLGSRDLAAFRAWFEEFEAVRFDRRIAEDCLSGRLDSLADEVSAEYRRGETRDL